MPVDYPYLAATVMGFMIVMAVYMVAPSLRRFMLAGGLALLPFSACAVFHEYSYWNAGRLGGLRWGVEDLLFTFSVGSLIAGLGMLIIRLRLPDRLNWRLSALKYCVTGLSGTALAFFFMRTGMDVMLATITTQLLMIALLSVRGRYPLWRPPATALLYTGYYAAMMLVFFFLFPSFAGHWNGAHLWPLTIIGLPLEEIVWVFTFAWSWILILMFCLDVQIKTQGDVCAAI